MNLGAPEDRATLHTGDELECSGRILCYYFKFYVVDIFNNNVIAQMTMTILRFP